MAIRGYTQATYMSSGSGTVAWPSGTVAGDTAWLGMAGTLSSTPKRQPTDTTGWQLAKKTPSTQSWVKVLSAADLAQPLAVQGCIAFLVTLPGQWRLGQVTEKTGANMSSAAGQLIVFGRGKSALTPATGKLGTDVQNAAYSNRYNNVWSLAATATGFLQLATGFNGTDSDGFEMIPPAAPSAPVLSAPASGAQVNPAIANTFSWLHQSLAGRSQGSYKLRLREVGAGSWSYLVSGTLTGTETAVAGSAQQATLNASALTSAHNYEWSVATTEDGVNWSPWAASQPFSAVAAPVVTAVTVSAPAGDVTPDVSYTKAVGSGVQTAYQVAVTPSASTDPTVGTIYDSGVVSGTDNPVTIPDLRQWTNGQDLKFWVRIWQTGGLASQWVSGTGTVSWTPPSAPTAVVATDGRPLSVAISGLTVGMLTQLQSSEDGGLTWVDQLTLTPASTTVTVDQPLAAYGVSTVWRVRRADTTGRWSSWTVSAAAASSDRCSYWVGDDGQWINVRVREDDPGQLVQDAATYYPLSDGYARIDYSAEHGWAGQMVLRVPTAAEVEAIIAFLRTHAVWTMRWVPDRGLDGSMVSRPVTRMARSSLISLDRLTQAAIQNRLMPLSWVEQGPA